MDSTSTANPTISALNEFPLLKEFVIEVAETTQAPLELVLASALTVLSLLCQPLIDVRRPGDMIGPISLLIILIANSGERKTTVERSAIHEPHLLKDRASAYRGISGEQFHGSKAS